jgi:BarA-like signal transduction histidine kinase
LAIQLSKERFFRALFLADTLILAGSGTKKIRPDKICQGVNLYLRTRIVESD